VLLNGGIQSHGQAWTHLKCMFMAYCSPLSVRLGLKARLLELGTHARVLPDSGAKEVRCGEGFRSRFQ